MNRQLLEDSMGWGFVLWVIGYILGIVLFFTIPLAFIGWTIMPLGVFITLWVLVTRVRTQQPRDYLVLAVTWTAMAIVLDYLFIMKAFNPPDGYYKLDVYLYYVLTFLLPLTVAIYRRRPAIRPTR
jgi:hypothetical protein